MLNTTEIVSHRALLLQNITPTLRAELLRNSTSVSRRRHAPL